MHAQYSEKANYAALKDSDWHLTVVVAIAPVQVAKNAPEKE
jgi:hypothetical protein